MIRRRLARAALRCYPQDTRTTRGAEMLDTVLEASDGRHGVFVWNILSLVAAGLGERARTSARLGAGRTIADAAKLAAVLYACLWLTAGLAVLIGRSRWHHDPRVSVYLLGLLIIVLAWWRGLERTAGVIGLVATGLLVLAHRPDHLLPVATVQPILPACGYVVMAVAPTREHPSNAAAATLAALVVVSAVVPGANPIAFSQFIVLATASIAGLVVFAVQPRLAIAVAIIWTAIGMEQIVLAGSQSAPWKLLVATAPVVLAATAARAHVIRRRAI